MEGPYDASDVFGHSVMVTKSGWVFTGAGQVLDAHAIDGGSGDVRVKLYDTVKLNYGEHDKVAQLACLAANAVERLERPVPFSQGCYVKLEGTNPQAIVRVGSVDMGYSSNEA
jgi:hypothetical protein